MLAAKDYVVKESPAFTEDETSAYIGMSRSYLRKQRSRYLNEGTMQGPPYVKIGSRILYLRADIDAWLEKNKKSM